MSRYITLILILLASPYVNGDDTVANTHTLNSKTMKALPGLCDNYDFYKTIKTAAVPANAIAQSVTTTTHAPSTSTHLSAAPQQSYSERTPSKMSGLKRRLKDKLYSLLNKHLSLDIHSYTHIKANDHVRFELEPSFSLQGEFKSLSLTAILFE